MWGIIQRPLRSYPASLISRLSNHALKNSGCSVESPQGKEGPSCPPYSLQISPSFSYLHIGLLCRITFELKILQLEINLETDALGT